MHCPGEQQLALPVGMVWEAIICSGPTPPAFLPSESCKFVSCYLYREIQLLLPVV